MKTNYDVIIIGGSYSGLAAAMALGRALKSVLIIDSGSPPNKQTPYSHNFLTRDGSTPAAIAAEARKQVEKYPAVSFLDDIAVTGKKTGDGFMIGTKNGAGFTARKLIFATGIRDILPPVKGLSECWGISVLHCPFCHGYEVRNEPTAIIGNGESAFELVRLISNWSKELTLYTNGPSTLTPEQKELLAKNNIKITEQRITQISHESGYVQEIVLAGGARAAVKAIYVRAQFDQHCLVPKALGCEHNADGYIVTNASQETTVEGIFACGDNSSRMRTVANAVGSGTAAGMAASKALISEAFNKK